MEVGKGGRGMDTERDFAWGDGHMIQCSGDILLSCTLKICTLINLIKKILITSPV